MILDLLRDLALGGGPTWLRALYVAAIVLAIVATLASALWRVFQFRAQLARAVGAAEDHGGRIAAVEQGLRPTRIHGRQLAAHSVSLRELRVEQVTLRTELGAQRDDLAQLWRAVEALNASAMRRAGNGGGHAADGTGTGAGLPNAAAASERKT